MSKKLFTLQVDALEEKDLGPRTETKLGTGRGRDPGSSNSVNGGSHWPKWDISRLSRTHLACKARQTL